MNEIAFGTDGWRSTVDTDFNQENVSIVARAICNYLHKTGIAEKGCVVAYDTRAHSRAFAETVANILAENGVPALFMKAFCPTPQAAFAVKLSGAAGAVMITASHNPPEYNGIKFIPHYAGPATPDITDGIESEIQAITGEDRLDAPPARSPAQRRILDADREYVDQLLSLIDFDAIEKSNLEVIFDAMYGAGQDIFLRVLERMNVEAAPIHCRIDPDFGGLLPEPIEANLGDLRKALAGGKAEIGVALDGDADRFGVMDSRGVYLSPNKALTLILWYLLENRPVGGAVARTLATTHMLDTVAERNGQSAFETPVGFKYVGELMRREKILLGGEESGGMSVAGHIPEKDGLVACLLLIEIAARLEKPLSVLLDEVYTEYGPCYDERIDVRIGQEEKETLLETLRENPPSELAGEPVVRVDLRDGVKAVTENQTWMLARPSGTEPLVRVYIEARSREAFDKVRESALKIVKG